ncbi:MAG: lysophospholipid acyltransferase family protein [Planctomycetia bacterium]
MARRGGRLLLGLGRARAAAARAALGFLERWLPSLSLSGLQALAWALGSVVWLVDRRGRAVARQNVLAVLGATHGPAARARIVRASYRNAVLSELLLFHLQPPSPARCRRLVRMDPADEARYRAYASSGRPVVLVSAHLGSWELLVLSRAAFAFAPDFAYLVESSGSPALDATLERLRNAGSGGSALRKRGAMALKNALAQGKSVSLMMDRNLRGMQGGHYVPFLGLQARTTPLGAVLARAYRVPLCVVLLLPERPLRWRLWISDDLLPAPGPDEEADVREALRRANDLLSEAVRAHPEAYLWNLKRFKGRPCADPAGYPAYSEHDPD